MARIALFDHYYHAKTGSSAFFTELLAGRGHTVDLFPDKREGMRVDRAELRNYDAVIFYQIRPEEGTPPLRLLHPNVVHMPMLDHLSLGCGAGANFSGYWEPFQGSKVIAFSSAVHASALTLGVSSFLFRWYPPPNASVPRPPAKDLRGFFWLRREDQVSWPMIRTLIGETHFTSLHLHVAPDPDSPPPQLPPQEDCAKYNITQSSWFERQEDFLRVLDNADVFFASRSCEGIGMSFLEAMARGQCVIARDHGTMNEYILHGVNGLLYNGQAPAPLDFSNVAELGGQALESIRSGHARRLEHEEQLIAYLLTPSEELYRDGYHHPLTTAAKAARAIRNTLRRSRLMRSTEKCWMPLWRAMKKRQG